MSFERIFVTKDTPTNVPDGAGAVVKKGTSPKLYLEGENGEAVESAGIIETGTLTADWNGDNTSVPYLKQGNIVMLHFRDVVQDPGQPITILTVPENLRPSAARHVEIYEGDAVNKVVPAVVGTNGAITITGALEYLLIGNLTYFI